VRVRVEGRLTTLRASDALGDGGEAVVFRQGDRAIKIYHGPCTARRVAKLECLVRRRSALPDHVVAPRALVTDASGGRVVGFTMDALSDGHHALCDLAHPKRRAALGVSIAGVAAMFDDGSRSLTSLHRQGVVVGDLNDGNEMFSPSSPTVLRFIDVDSFQVGGFPCEVSTDGFLAPELYGPDLSHPCQTADGRPREFRPEHDWYAFAVLLFRSLTGVHPYGGVDTGLPSLTRRAAARRSVFSASVRVPNVAMRGIDGLPTDLRAWFEAVFERGARGPIPEGELHIYRDGLVACSSCHAAKPRSAPGCPSCGHSGLTTALGAGAPHATRPEACHARALIATDGSIVSLVADGAYLSVVARAGDRLVYHRVQTSGDVQSSDLVSVRGPCFVEAASHALLVAVPSPGRAGADVPVSVFGLTDGMPTGIPHNTTTERFGAGDPAFAVGQDAYYRIARGVLMACQVRAGRTFERPITSVMRGQTWVTAAPTGRERLVCGSRALRRRHYFAWSSGRRVDLEVAVLGETEAITDESVVFGEGNFALLRLTRLAGESWVRLALFADDGTCIAEHAVRAADRLAGAAIHGGVLAGRRHLVATGAGLVRELLGAGESVRFDATAPHCGEAASLAVFAGGVVCGEASRAVHLSLSAPTERSSP